jgi:membrane associated rhomboid family serine protease
MIMVSLLDPQFLRELVVLITVAVSVISVLSVATTAAARRTIRQRLLFGVPWGTLLGIVLLAAVYLFLQQPRDGLRDPLVLPFRAWSYSYPLGMITAAFTHASPAHLLGNLTGTLVFGSLAEYVWGHYPRRRGVQSFTGPLTNPYFRVVVVPLFLLPAGLATAAFALGPVIGFSGVVFALAGFALITRPIPATLGLFALQVGGLVLATIRSPKTVFVPRPRVVSPWWADVAIQGHALGLLLGLLIGIWYAWRTDRFPSPGRLWFALVAFATVQGLWAVYIPGDNGQATLFRWVGVVLIFLLSALVVVTVSRDAERSIPTLYISARSFGLLLIIALLLSMGAAGVPYNVAPIGAQDGPGDSVSVQGYHVGYAENTSHGYVEAVSLPGVGSPGAVNTSGVIVTNDRREIWFPVVSAGQLAQQGSAAISVGGVGWRRSITANRTGWQLAGGDAVYAVSLRTERGPRTEVFQSPPASAAPVIAGKTIAIARPDDGFQLVVRENGSVIGRGQVPIANGTTRIAGIEFRREGAELLAKTNGTRVQVARAE